MSTEELDASLMILLDTLPDEHEGPQRRKYALTKHDAELISKMIKVAAQNQGCSIGLTSQQMAAIKDVAPGTFREIREIVKERRRVLNAIGLMTLAVLGWIGKLIFEAVDWSKVWSVFHK